MSEINYAKMHLPFDIRVEALAACLIESDPEQFNRVEQFLVRPLGHLTRLHGPEIRQLHAADQWTEGDEAPMLYIDINREGLFDILPGLLFLHPDDAYDSDEDKAEQLARQTADARRFLLPFEEIVYQAKIAVEVNEQNRLLEMEKLLSVLWGLAEDDENQPGIQGKNVDEKTQRLALYMPFIGQIIQSEALRDACLARVLGCPVRVYQRPPAAIEIPPEMQTILGENAFLGENVLAGSTYFDGTPMTVVEVLLDEIEATEQWLPGKHDRVFAESTLLPMFFAADATPALEVGVNDKLRDFTLNPDISSARLGYVTHL